MVIQCERIECEKTRMVDVPHLLDVGKAFYGFVVDNIMLVVKLKRAIKRI
jgi:hypothetical protein